VPAAVLHSGDCQEVKNDVDLNHGWGGFGDNPGVTGRTDAAAKTGIQLRRIHRKAVKLEGQPDWAN
jgi:hypothetical protein